MNRTCHPLNDGSPDITLTDPLIKKNLIVLPDLAFKASKFDAILKSASKGLSPRDFRRSPDSLDRPSSRSHGRTIEGWDRWSAAVLWDKISSIQNDFTPFFLVCRDGSCFCSSSSSSSSSSSRSSSSSSSSSSVLNS